MSTDSIIRIISLSVAAYCGISLYRQLRRAEKLVDEMPAKIAEERKLAFNEGLMMGELRMQPAIDQAKHIGWNEGREYQIALEQRRHPRDPKTKQFVSRT